MKTSILGNYIYLFILLFFQGLILFSCNTKVGKIETLPDFELVIEDTLKINYQGNLSIVDFDEKRNLFLAVDKAKRGQAILVIDYNGEVSSIFDNLTAGGNAFKGTLNSLSFNSADGGFYVLTDLGMYQFGNNWELISFFGNENKNPKFLNSYFSMKHFSYGDKNLIIAPYNSKTLAQKYNNSDFFKNVENLTVIDLENKNFETFLNFENESNYLNSSITYPPYFTHFTVNPKDGTLSVVYSQDPNLYQYKYDGSKFNLVSLSKLNLDHFKIELENYIQGDYDIYKTSLDSRINRLISIEDTHYITYLKAMDHQKFNALEVSYDDSEKYRNFITENFTEYISILENGKKISNDIVVPTYLTGPVLPLGKGKLLMSLPKFKFEFDSEIFFIVNVQPKFK